MSWLMEDECVDDFDDHECVHTFVPTNAGINSYFHPAS